MEVVFDIGNVLVRWDPRNLYRKLFDDPQEMERFLHEALAMSFIVETDVVQSFAAAIEARAAQYPRYSAELRAFDTRWMETLGGPIEENVKVLRGLKAGAIDAALIDANYVRGEREIYGKARAGGVGEKA